MDRFAIIDCGTNTFHLMIVELLNDKTTILHKEKVAVKIGEGGISTSTITEAAQERAINCMLHFRSIIKEHAIENVFASATSALRNADNGKTVIDKIYQQTAIKIRLISGKEEAAFIFKGVQQAVKLTEKPSLIMDIGGGSVEFIIADQNKIHWLESFEIGAQRLLDQFHNTDPISFNELSQLFSFLKQRLKPLLNAIDQYQPANLIGSSGTFDTLVDMDYATHNLKKDDQKIAFELSISSYRELYESIISKNREERLSIPGMIEMRVDMIVVAVGLIQFILDYHSFKRIDVSTYALKEGVMKALIEDEIAFSL